MAKPDDSLSLALANLAASPWPAAAEEAEKPGSASLQFRERPEPDLLGAASSRHFNADRFTCRTDATRVDVFRRRPKRKSILISAIDADASMPILLAELLANLSTATRLAGLLAKALDADVRFALPADPGGPRRSALKALGRIVWVPPQYPAGHYRLLPRAAGVERETLLLDTIALLDIGIIASTGAPATTRRVTLTHGGSTTRFARAGRDARIAGLFDGTAETIYAGPRLADRMVGPTDTIGDGEFTFYAEPRGDRFASPCIRCGDCVEVCPTRVDPVALLGLASGPTPHARRARRFGLDACIDCGLCTAVCPSAIELHHNIRALRDKQTASGAAG